MSAPPSLDSLAEDLGEIKTYLTTQDNLCQSTIKAFLSRYDALGPALLIRSSSSLFKDHELLEALLDNWEGLLEPVTFVKFIYTFCLIEDKSITYTMFLESGGSTEVLRAMDTNVKSKELVYYGGRCLAVLSSNEELRTSLSEGDGISLIVDSLHAHKRDKEVALVLLVVLVNLVYQNPDSKKAFADSSGIPITCSIIASNHNHSDLLQISFHLLRHVSADKPTRIAEAKGRTQIFKEVITALNQHTQNEPLITHALWIFLNLMNGSHDNKEKFLHEHGLSVLDSITREQERNEEVAALVVTVVQQILKLQRVRTDLYAKGVVTMLGRNLVDFIEAKPLIATYKALHTFSLHTSARTTIGKELFEPILAHIRLPHLSSRLYAIIGKLILRLCLDDSVKKIFQEHHATEAVRVAMDHTKDHQAALRFFVAAELFLQSPPGSTMPIRPTVADVLLLQHISADSQPKMHGNPAEHEAFDHMLLPPKKSQDSDDSDSDSETSSDSGEDKGASDESDDDISAMLRSETSPPHSPTGSPQANGDVHTENSKHVERNGTADNEIDPNSNQASTIPVVHVEADPIDFSLGDDPEMDALLKDIEISASPTPSPRKLTNRPSSNTPSKHHRRASRGSPSHVQSLDDSLQDLESELEKLRNDDIGSRILDDLELDLGLTETTDEPVASLISDPDAVLARIEAIEREAAGLDAPTAVALLTNTSLENEGVTEHANSADSEPQIPTPTENTLPEVDALLAQLKEEATSALVKDPSIEVSATSEINDDVGDEIDATLKELEEDLAKDRTPNVTVSLDPVPTSSPIESSEIEETLLVASNTSTAATTSHTPEMHSDGILALPPPPSNPSLFQNVSENVIESKNESDANPSALSAESSHEAEPVLTLPVTQQDHVNAVTSDSTVTLTHSEEQASLVGTGSTAEQEPEAVVELSIPPQPHTSTSVTNNSTNLVNTTSNAVQNSVRAATLEVASSPSANTTQPQASPARVTVKTKPPKVPKAPKTSTATQREKPTSSKSNFIPIALAGALLVVLVAVAAKYIM